MGAGASAKSSEQAAGGPEYSVETTAGVEGLIAAGEKVILKIANEAVVLLHPEYKVRAAVFLCARPGADLPPSTETAHALPVSYDNVLGTLQPHIPVPRL